MDYWEIATPDAGGRRDTADWNVTATVIFMRPQTRPTTAVAETRVAFTPPMVTVTGWPATGGGWVATTPSPDGGELCPIPVANNVKLHPGVAGLSGPFGSWFGLRAAACPRPV